jgi:hypothetical protein
MERYIGKSDENLRRRASGREPLLTMGFERVLLSLYWLQAFVSVYKCLQTFITRYWRNRFVLIIN